MQISFQCLNTVYYHILHIHTTTDYHDICITSTQPKQLIQIIIIMPQYRIVIIFLTYTPS